MKKIVVCLLIFVVMQSCKKETEEGLQRIEINAEVAQGEVYHFNLKQYIEDKEFPVITRPPLNYHTSRILFNGNISGPVYEFISDASATRSEQAIIKIVREHEHSASQLEHDEMNHGENDDYTSVIITITFSIK